MLGCQDFCGYYDWTFNHVRQRFGAQAVAALWADAIGTDSQRHYLQAGQSGGLRGLKETWCKTGEEEHCDWTFTLDEQRQVLRWDMRKCPSKGLLLENDLNADEDYCDHCAGWITNMLAQVGFAFEHEHNHCGQCWGEIHPQEGPWETLKLPVDIRHNKRWGQGYLDGWKDSRRVPLLPDSSAEDSVAALEKLFERCSRILVLSQGALSAAAIRTIQEYDAVFVTDSTYVRREVYSGGPAAVLIEEGSQHLEQVAQRYLATPPAQRPVLLHAYLPLALPDHPLNFAQAGLPRPWPVLPLLIRRGYYTHQPRQAHPAPSTFLALTATALGKQVAVAGMDLSAQSGGSVTAASACNHEILQQAVALAQGRLWFLDEAGNNPASGSQARG